MKGRSPTRAEKMFHDKLAGLGCIVCRQLDYDPYSPVSIHHIYGRTRKDAHAFVLPLCAGHHQQGTGAAGLIAVHPNKAEFERAYGTQLALLERCLDLLA